MTKPESEIIGRAAIAAMREPTREMLTAAVKAVDANNGAAVEIAYKTAIDEALK